jgi:hypothetical protein
MIAQLPTLVSMFREENIRKKQSLRLAKQRFDVKVEVGKGVAAQAAHAVRSYVVEPVIEPLARRAGEFGNKIKKKVRRSVRQAVEVAKIRARRLYMKTNGHFDEIQRELKYEIYRQYLDHHVQLAKDKARREFNVIESGPLLGNSLVTTIHAVTLPLVFLFLSPQCVPASREWEET